MKLYSLMLALSGLSWAHEQIPFNPSGSSIASIPALGFGTWNLDKSNASEAVSVALRTGYRHLDCAAIYGNEKEVGNGIKDGLEAIGLDRSSIWITSKLWNDQYAYKAGCLAYEHIIVLTHCIVIATGLIKLRERSTRH